MNLTQTRLSSVSSVSSSRKESGTLIAKLLYSLLIVAILAGLWLGVGQRFFAAKTKTSGVIHVPVVRGTFVHEINGKGNAESAKNIDIACQVEGNVTVIWIIPEGEVVKEGDELVLLDSSNIEDKLNTQQSSYSTSLANVASAQATLQTAELSLEEYIEGTFQQEWTKIENSIYSSKQTQKQKGDSVRFTERLVQLGYTTSSQLDVDRVAEQSAINTVRSSLLEQIVLLKYTSEKRITELISSIETARANVDSKNYTNLLDKNRLEYYRKQFENCTIKAPQDGQVVYANQDNRRFASESDMIKEGATVRERQVLIRLPDPSQMQVKAMINESNISSVRVGMKAIIAFDAMTNRTFEGTVIKVNQYPEVVWMSSAKDYVTIIRIEDSAPDLRAGLTAEVRVVAEKLENVLMLPIQAVIEVNKKTFCLQNKEGIWSCKEVLLGSSNDKQVVVLAGLEENEIVVNGARQYKEKVDFPDATAPSQFEEEKKKLGIVTPEKKEDQSKEAPAESAPPQKSPGGAIPQGAPGMRPPGGQGMPGGAIPQGAPGMRPPGGQGMPGGAIPQGAPGMRQPGGQGMPSGAIPQGAPGMRPPGGQGMPSGAIPQGAPGMRPPGGQGMPGGIKGDATRDRGSQEGGPEGVKRPRRRSPDEQGNIPGGSRAGGSGPVALPGTLPGGANASAAPVKRDRPVSKTGNVRKGMSDHASGSTEKAQQEEAKEEARTLALVKRIKAIAKYFDLTAMELCRKVDTDGNKKISREEVSKVLPEMAAFFDEWDRNKDGSLSQTDLVIGFCTCRNLYRKVALVEEKTIEENEPQSKLQEFMTRSPKEIFIELDKNKDGFVVDDEITGTDDAEVIKRFLNRLDSDRDGKISQDEFVKGINSMKSRMKSGYRRN